MTRVKAKPLTVMILSGGTGRTADYVVTAALAQFDVADAKVVKETGVRTVRSATASVRRAADAKAILCHTLVCPKVRAAVAEQTRRLNVPTVDVLGPILTALDDQSGMRPIGKPGLSYELRKEHFDSIDAVDFTLAHDDGQRAEELHLADVVLVGVSRVSKSVTCFYLAARGIRAANMPLLPGHKVPPELLRLGPKKVVGLTMNANHLRSIREARLCRLSNTALPSYVDDRRIIDELRYARTLMSRQKWPCIDVSYMATEEVAHEVLSLIGQ